MGHGKKPHDTRKAPIRACRALPGETLVEVTARCLPGGGLCCFCHRQNRTTHMINFEYPEDREFFIQLLADGDVTNFDEKFKDLFDFRHPAIKRWEFNKVRKKVLEELIERYNEECQLQLHEDCSKEKVWHPDHIIPLSTNELNKKLRKMERTGSEKVPAQSFGSNHSSNLILACKRCNYYKKHRLMLPKKFKLP